MSVLYLRSFQLEIDSPVSILVVIELIEGDRHKSVVLGYGKSAWGDRECMLQKSLAYVGVGRRGRMRTVHVSGRWIRNNFLHSFGLVTCTGRYGYCRESKFGLAMHETEREAKASHLHHVASSSPTSQGRGSSSLKSGGASLLISFLFSPSSSVSPGLSLPPGLHARGQSCLLLPTDQVYSRKIWWAPTCKRRTWGCLCWCTIRTPSTVLLSPSCSYFASIRTNLELGSFS